MIPGRLSVAAIATLQSRASALAANLAADNAIAGMRPGNRIPGNGAGRQGPARSDGPRRDEPDGPTGFIVVRLGDVPRRNGEQEFETLEDLARAAGMDDLIRVIHEFDMGRGRPLIRSVSQQRLRELEARARQSELPRSAA